jgi:hypothetical protein
MGAASHRGEWDAATRDVTHWGGVMDAAMHESKFGR